MDQQYCLRWHNHPTNLTGVLMSLLQREALCDVTLAVEGETIKAHQTILSACSPYFETIFIQNTHPHPIMYLKDVDYVDLKAIIEYMYKGEVNVAQRSLPKFLKTAEGLQVKGLVESNNLNPSSIYRPSSDGDRNSTDTPPNYPSDNNNPSKYENLDRRDIDERSSIIGDKIGDKEAHIEFRDYGDKDMHDAHLDLSPVLDKHSRKRRNPSNCDTPSSLPQTQIPLSRHFSESQASSHSSYKLSPLPKSNSLEADTDGRRKSPVTNSLAGIQQQQQQQISIKQEASDITSGLPLPQVHLNPNPMNQNLLPNSKLIGWSIDPVMGHKMSPTNQLQGSPQAQLTVLKQQQQLNYDFTQKRSSPAASASSSCKRPSEKEELDCLLRQTQLLVNSMNQRSMFNRSQMRDQCVMQPASPGSRDHRTPFTVPYPMNVGHSTQQSSQTSTTRKTGRFRLNWLEQFSWLKYDDINNTMFCIYCRKWSNDIPDIRTSFVEGNSNFRLEIVNHHDKCKAHKMCREREQKSNQDGSAGS